MLAYRGAMADTDKSHAALLAELAVPPRPHRVAVVFAHRPFDEIPGQRGRHFLRVEIAIQIK